MYKYFLMQIFFILLFKIEWSEVVAWKVIRQPSLEKIKIKKIALRPPS